MGICDHGILGNWGNLKLNIIVTVQVTVTGACNSFATRSRVAKEMQARDGNATAFVGIINRT
jgi:hypothetical protein